MFFKNVIQVGSVTLVSRILGLIRDTMIALFLGASSSSDAFVIAFKLPNTFRRLFAEGSLNPVFVPIYSELLYKRPREAQIFASEIFTILTVLLIVLIAVVEIFMPQFTMLFAPGFKTAYPKQFDLAVNLTRITLSYLLFMSLSALYAAMLNSLKKFALAAALPFILNISIIGFLLLSKVNDLGLGSAYFGCFGIAFAGFVQFLIISLRVKQLGLWPRFCWITRLHQGTKDFFRRVLPTIISAGTYQINIFIDLTIASWLAGGSITYLYYADRLSQLPLAMIGIAMSTVIVPYISNGESTIKEARAIKTNAILYSMLLGSACAAAFLVLGQQIVIMLFNYGKFDLYSASQTYKVLCFYAIGLMPNVVIKIVVAIFYAKKETRIPFYVNLGTLVLNTILCIILSRRIGVCGIALATCISSIVSVVVLLMILFKKRYLTVSTTFWLELMKGLAVTAFVFGLYEVLIVLHLWDVSIRNHLRLTIYTLSMCVALAGAWFLGLKLVKSALYEEIFLGLFRNASKRRG